MKTKLFFALVLSLACTVLFSQDLSTTASTDASIKVTTVKPGTGIKPSPGKEVSFHIVVSTPDGDQVFSTQDMNVPVHETVGEDTDKESVAVYDAMQKSMQEGGKYRLEVPKDILRNPKTADDAGVDYLVYEIYLLDVTDAKPSGAKLLKETVSTQGVDAAKAKFDQLRSGQLSGYTLVEWDMNLAGYDLLQANNPDAAIALFQMNTQLNPGSWNAYDSLGDAYLAKEDKANAKASFEKALKLNPDFAASKEKLSDL